MYLWKGARTWRAEDNRKEAVLWCHSVVPGVKLRPSPRALTFWTMPPASICKLNSKVTSGKMVPLQWSVFPCCSMHSSFYINTLFYIIFKIFKGEFSNNQERPVKPKLDTKIATSTPNSMYHETLSLLRLMHSFPFYHHWNSPERSGRRRC